MPKWAHFDCSTTIASQADAAHLGNYFRSDIVVAICVCSVCKGLDLARKAQGNRYLYLPMFVVRLCSSKFRCTFLGDFHRHRFVCRCIIALEDSYFGTSRMNVTTIIGIELLLSIKLYQRRNGNNISCTRTFLLKFNLNIIMIIANGSRLLYLLCSVPCAQ